MPAESTWPESMPSLQYYKDYYAENKQHQEVLSERAYLGWIKKFYLGSMLYRRGWNMMTNELVSSLDNSDNKNLTRKKMKLLGKRISAEWAKDTRFSLIKTRHISIWGNALLESISKNQQLMLISKVEQDVDALLTRKITSDAIRADRYHPPSEWDDF